VARRVKQPHGGEIVILEKGETANPNGRPPRLATTVIRELRERGIAKVDSSEVDELIGRLQNLSETELTSMSAAPDTPMVVSLIAKGLCSDKGHEFMTRDLWDRAHGKPTQAVDHTTGGQALPSPIIQILPPSGEKGA
jgi:hypothetical protein